MSQYDIHITNGTLLTVVEFNDDHEPSIIYNYPFGDSLLIHLVHDRHMNLAVAMRMLVLVAFWRQGELHPHQVRMAPKFIRNHLSLFDGVMVAQLLLEAGYYDDRGECTYPTDWSVDSLES